MPNTLGLVTGKSLEDTADAIRVLNGSADTYTPSEMAPAILDAIPTETASGSLIHITDAAAYPTESVVTTLEPVQDLHGYDKPWPAGGGKNKVDIADMNITSQTTMGRVTLPSGTYVASATVKNNSNIGGYIRINTSSSIIVQATISDVSGTNRIATNSFTLSEPTEIVVVVAGNSSGYNFDVSQVQLELGDTATSYEPYSNICPITGHTGDGFTRTGKNLYSGSSTVTKDDSTVYVSERLPVKLPAGTYTISALATLTTDVVSARISFRNQNRDNIEIGQLPAGSGQRTSFTITLYEDTYFIYFFGTSGTSAIASATFADIQIESGNTATTYEPYQGSTHTATFPSTVYGGEHDWTEGALTSSWTSKTITSAYGVNVISGLYYISAKISPSGINSDRTTRCLSDKFVDNGQVVQEGNTYITNYGNTAVFVGPQTITTKEEADAWLADNPVQIVYKLAEPTETTLTPEAIPLLKGENNIWTDSGSTEIEYKVDLQSYLDKIKSQQSASTLSASPLSLSKSAVLTSTDGADADEIEEVDEPVLYDEVKVSEDEEAVLDK